MTRTESALFTLLRAGIWGREPDNLELFPLSQKEWGEVYRMAQEQTVSGQVFQGVCQLNEELMPPLDLLQVWLAQVDQIERTNRMMNKAVQELTRLFREKGLHPILLKGQGVAQLYEEPLQRSCGDIDLYFDNQEEYQRACRIAVEEGLKPEWSADGGCHYQWNNVEVEHHDRLIDIHNPFHQKAIRRLIDTEGFDGIYPKPLTNMLLLNAHILKHMLGHGIGLRQIADFARACYRLEGQYPKDHYASLCRSWGIGKWCQELNGLLTEHMGLAPEYLPYPTSSHKSGEYILQKILKGGNFGKHNGSRGKEGDSNLKKKRKTAMSLLKGWRLAPSEGFWTLMVLGWGAIKGFWFRTCSIR